MYFIKVMSPCLCRLQAQVGSLLAALVPAARMVPAVRPEDMSQDPEVVRDYIEVRCSLQLMKA